MLYIAKNTNQAKQLSKRYKDKQLRKLCRGIYSDDLKSSIEELILNNWMDIVAQTVPEGILSYRTAIELKPTTFKNKFIVFVTSSYAKTINLPGLIIKIYKGDKKKYHEQVLPNLARSSLPRTLLENLSTVRGAQYKKVKTIGISNVERILGKELHLRGKAHLNQLRDDAKKIAVDLNYMPAFKKLNNLISALLSTHAKEDLLITDYAKAIVQQRPFDENRIRLFDTLVLYLKRCNFLSRSYQYNRISFKNLSFYEAYFSNFIEGTEFIIDEAEDIVFKGQEIYNRHADSHDVLSSFNLSNDYSEMCITPETAGGLIEILQNRHAILMKERPEKRPGEFKIKPNKAGNTYFVSPEDTTGTLYQGFERYKLLNPGMEKALFMQFLISEVHPFDDGNGRLSRLMMNAELVQHGDYKIMIPSVHRDNYLNGLRLASRDENFRIYVKVMDQAQAYTASVNWLDYGEAREKIEADNANLNADEGLPTFTRALRQLELPDFPA